jgi:diaminohydroxyphosphoribosylaminopyrimidine deaminase/5-amino-6-(5-phosphoribosylamino)uracil reductase
LKNEDDGNKLFRKIDKENNIIKQVLQQLYEMKIQSVLVEGGTKLLQSFIDDNYWDECRIITNEQLIIADGIQAPLLKNHSLLKTASYLSDHIYYYNHSRQA